MRQRKPGKPWRRRADLPSGLCGQQRLPEKLRPEPGLSLSRGGQARAGGGSFAGQGAACAQRSGRGHMPFQRTLKKAGEQSTDTVAQREVEGRRRTVQGLVGLWSSSVSRRCTVQGLVGLWSSSLSRRCTVQGLVGLWSSSLSWRKPS